MKIEKGYMANDRLTYIEQVRRERESDSEAEINCMWMGEDFFLPLSADTS